MPIVQKFACDRAYERMVASADEQKEAFHFYDAYELYSTVALDVHERVFRDSSVVEDEVYRNAIDCAIRAGNLMAAVAMSDTLIAAGLGDQQDWNQRVNLALNLGNDASAGHLDRGKRGVSWQAWIKK